jgi:hypothetical protein
MSRTLTIEKTVYTYDELSDSAKETVRQKFSEWGWEDSTMQENMQMIADGVLESHGFGPARGLTYSLYTQGGEPSFETEGTWTDPETEKVYDVTVTQHPLGGSNYYMTVWATEKDNDDEDEIGCPDDVRSRLTDFMRVDIVSEMSKKFYAEDEYQASDAVVRESCEANGYEFDEYGNMA